MKWATATLASRASHVGLTEQGLTNGTTLLPSPTEAPESTSHIFHPTSLDPAALGSAPKQEEDSHAVGDTGCTTPASPLAGQPELRTRRFL